MDGISRYTGMERFGMIDEYSPGTYARLMIHLELLRHGYESDGVAAHLWCQDGAEQPPECCTHTRYDHCP